MDIKVFACYGKFGKKSMKNGEIFRQFHHIFLIAISGMLVQMEE